MRYIEITKANQEKRYYQTEDDKLDRKKFEEDDLYVRWCQREEVILDSRRFIEDKYRYSSDKIYIGKKINERTVYQKVHAELSNYWFSKGYSEYLLLADGRVKPIKSEQEEGIDYVIR